MVSRAVHLARRSPRHLAWRVGQEGRRELDRVLLAAARHGRGPVARERFERDAGLLAATRAGGASLGAWAAAATHARADPPLRAEVARRSARALRGEVEAFGDEPLILHRPLPWTSDPRAGFRFPDGFHRRLDYREIDRRCDVKVPWEISRLRLIVELAQGHLVGDDVSAREAAIADLDDWVRRNPVGWTVNWAVAMEVALRAVNLICADAMLVAAGASDDERGVLVSSLFQHGWFLARNLEVAELNGNHYLADAVGLVWLGRYFGGRRDAAGWLREGRAMVRAAAAEQVLPDGLDHEGSLPYHVLVLELFLLAIAADGELVDDVAEPARRMTDALCAVTGPGGRVPDIGDDDGGRAAALSALPSRDARHVLALAATVLGHAPAAAAAGDDPLAWEDALWLTGPEAVAAARAGAAPRAAGPVHLGAGGIVVLGDGADRIVVDVGPVGFRGRGGHGHLDAMSFEAMLGGRLVVRDSGTGSYTGDALLRERLRDAAGHNVVIVDDRRYAALGGVERLWAIDGDAPPRVLALEADGARQTLIAEQRLPAAGGEALWRREITWTPGRLECRDTVRAPAGARVAHHLQLPTDGAVEHVAIPAGATVERASVTWSERYGSTASGDRVTTTFVQRDEAETVAFAVQA
jgi:hypothetical protein